MTHYIHILLGAAAFAGMFTLSSANSRPTAVQIVAEAFRQIPLTPSGGQCSARRWLDHMTLSRNVEDRRDPIAVLIENN